MHVRLTTPFFLRVRSMKYIKKMRVLLRKCSSISCRFKGIEVYDGQNDFVVNVDGKFLLCYDIAMDYAGRLAVGAGFSFDAIMRQCMQSCIALQLSSTDVLSYICAHPIKAKLALSTGLTGFIDLQQLEISSSFACSCPEGECVLGMDGTSLVVDRYKAAFTCNPYVRGQVLPVDRMARPRDYFILQEKDRLALEKITHLPVDAPDLTNEYLRENLSEQ
jgi:hypothetical protein